jgi:hypothetical protein
MIVTVRLCVIGAIALSLPLLQHAQSVQSSSLELVLEQRNEAAVIEHHYGVAWCGSPTATGSQGHRYNVVDPASELQLQSLVETQ